MDSAIYEFGSFRLDPRNRELRRGAEAIALTPKVFDVLLALVERHGQLVSKDDLLQRVWPDTHVTEANLSQAVFVLRKALGETASTQRYIATVAGSGYRFTPEVRVVTSVAPPVANEQRAASIPAAPAAPDAQGWMTPKRSLLAAVVIAAIVVSAGMALRRGREEAPPAGTNGKTLLAVLPFANLTGDPGQDYFADG